jgi:hypothetical protein
MITEFSETTEVINSLNNKKLSVPWCPWRLGGHVSRFTFHSFALRHEVGGAGDAGGGVAGEGGGTADAAAEGGMKNSAPQ